MLVEVTWRAPEELVERVRAAAAGGHHSLNHYITIVLDAATNPDLSGSGSERSRERLARAGLLAATGAMRARPDPAALAEARAAAGAGMLAADMITDDRG